MGREEGPGAEAEKEGHRQLKPGGAAKGVCALSASFLSHLLLNFPFEALKQRQVRRSDCSKSYSKPGAELAWNPGCDSESCAPHSPHIHRMVAEERRCLPRELSSKGVFSTLLFQLPPPLARAPSSCPASEASLNHQGWKTALQVTH